MFRRTGPSLIAAIGITTLFIAAVLVGWFAPKHGYDVLVVLLIGTAAGVGYLFAWLTHLQHEVDQNTAFRVQHDESALAFQTPDFDYDDPATSGLKREPDSRRLRAIA